MSSAATLLTPLTTVAWQEAKMAAPEFTRPDTYGPAFQARRLEALERDKHRCCACNHDGSEYGLQVHHRTYENGENPKLEDLYTFCVRCHDVWTGIMRGDRYAGREVDTVEVRVTVATKPSSPDKNPVQIPEYKSETRTKPILRR